MNQLKAGFILQERPDIELNNSAALFDIQPPHQLDNLLWSETGYFPKVSFWIAHTPNSMLLRYKTEEKYIKAEYKNANDPVYKDSCVEFFISLDSGKTYYNFEFNPLGTILAGFGADKTNRAFLGDKLIARIKTHSVINKPEAETDSWGHWELTANIPFDVFIHHNITSLKGITALANFYKCGDDLPEPHYLSWNLINHPFPDFHLPQFFGKLHFS